MESETIKALGGSGSSSKELRKEVAELRKALRKARKLLEYSINSLERVGCQGPYCKGPGKRPVFRYTCHRCWTLRDLYRLKKLADIDE